MLENVAWAGCVAAAAAARGAAEAPSDDAASGGADVVGASADAVGVDEGGAVADVAADVAADGLVEAGDEPIAEEPHAAYDAAGQNPDELWRAGGAAERLAQWGLALRPLEQAEWKGQKQSAKV